MKTGSNPRLEWLLSQTARQFLISPHVLRRRDRQAWRVAARDAFCTVAYMHQLGSGDEIAATLGRDLCAVRSGIRRGAMRVALGGDLTCLAIRVLGRLTAEAMIQQSGPFRPCGENPPKTPSEAGFSAVRGGHTTHPPSLAPTPRPNAAYRNSTHPLTSSASE